MAMSTGNGADGPLVEGPVLERVLGAALARGGDLAEVFVEDRQT